MEIETPKDLLFQLGFPATLIGKRKTLFRGSLELHTWIVAVLLRMKFALRSGNS